MKFQQQSGSCGPAALSAALEAIGIERAEAELATLAGTSKDGTNHEGMLKALAVVRKSEPHVIGRGFQDRADVALMRLLRAIDDGHSIVVCVKTDEPWDHYSAIVGALGRARLIAFDPGASEPLRSLPIADFMDWWRGPPGERRPYYGIIL